MENKKLTGMRSMMSYKFDDDDPLLDKHENNISFHGVYNINYKEYFIPYPI